MNFVRQPLLPAFLTLVVFAAAAVSGRGEAVSSTGAAPSVMAEWLAEFGRCCPGWARVASFMSVILGGLCLVRLGNRYNLYSGSCYLVMPVFGAVVCGMFPASASLERYLVVLLLAWAVCRFCISLRNGYSFSDLFRASLLVGLAPLLSASAAGFVLLVPLALLLFKRTVREAAVAFFGLLLPSFLLCYLTWAFGGEFLSPVTTFIRALITERGTPFAPDFAVLVLPAYILLLTLGALLVHVSNFYILTQKGRLVVLFCILLLPFLIPLYLLPSASVSTLSMIAVPCSVLIPLFFVRIRQFAGVLFYLLLLLLGLSGILFV